MQEAKIFNIILALCKKKKEEYQIRWRKNKGRKIVKRFLIIPTTIEGETRWLEWAYIEKLYNDYYFNPWKNSRWIDWVNEK